MSGGLVSEAVAALRAAHDELAAMPVDALTAPELLEVLDELQTLTCQLPTQSHRLLARLKAETTSQAMGAKSWRDVLATRLRISTREAKHRLDEAAVLGPRRALSGERLDPVLTATAVAGAHGSINPEHVQIIRDAMTHLPAGVDTVTRTQIEVDLVRAAIGTGPKQLRDTADRIIFLLDQDGPEPDDTERDRRRGLSRGPQQPGGNIAVNGNLTPEGWAIYEAIFAKWAAPGMCNPADEYPCIAGTPTQAQIDNDHRSLAQRQHDALIAVGRNVLESGVLGQHNGLPTMIIIRTTLQDLESRAGVGVTGGGTILPIRDVIRLGGHAHHALAVFDGASGSALELFRTRRVASPAQRIMLIARDGGCTKPGCPVPAYGTQVHHAARDWADNGQTNVNELSLACGPDNRCVKPGGWTTRINASNEVEWIPPPHLDTGQTRVNTYHHPERLHPPPEPDGGDDADDSEADDDSDGGDDDATDHDEQPADDTTEDTGAQSNPDPPQPGAA